MAIVCDQPAEMMAALRAEQAVPTSCNIRGIITIEDVQELLTKTEISDETDAGVRLTMERGDAIRKRIQRLKALAAAEIAPKPLSRTPSTFRPPHSRHSSLHRAATDAAVASLRALSGLTSPPRSTASDAARFGYQAEATAGPSPADVNSPETVTITSTAVVSATASATPTGPSQLDGTSPSRVPRRLQLLASEASGSGSKLLRDDVFTVPKHIRAPSSVRSFAFDQSGSTMLPPPVAATVAAAANVSPQPSNFPPSASVSSITSHPPSHAAPRRATSSMLPRAMAAHGMEQGLARRDLTSATIAALRRMGSDISGGANLPAGSRESPSASAAPTRAPSSANLLSPILSPSPQTPVLQPSETTSLLHGESKV
jgi:hypothetical protein